MFYRTSLKDETGNMKLWTRNGSKGSNTAISAYLDIANSCMFDSGNSDYMSRTPSSAGNRKTWTFSTWVKRGKLGVLQGIFSGGSSASAECTITFDALEKISIWEYTGSYQLRRVTTQVFRDVGAWYHIVVTVDTTQTTASNRVKLYVNGSQVTSFSDSVDPSQNYDCYINNTVEHRVAARFGTGGDHLDGYLAETILIDGQALTPSSFGQFDSNGIWRPKEYKGTYGTNGFHLEYKNSGSLGADTSGNSNNYTSSGLTTSNQYGDTPTNNYCVLNPVDPFTNLADTISKGNLVASGSGNDIGIGTIGVSSGKWYWEVTMTTISGSDTRTGICDIEKMNRTSWPSDTTNGYAYMSDGNKAHNSSYTSYASTYAQGDVIGVALDLDTGQITFYKNGVSQGVAFSSLSGCFTPTTENGNGSTSKTFTCNFGQRSFTYTPPTGFKALCTSNLTVPAIVNGAEYFDIDLYTGTGSTLSRSSFEFQPDIVWIKSRSASTEHELTDSVRGATKALSCDSTNPESTDSNGVTAFSSNGFTVGTDTNYNDSGKTYVAWCWKKGSTPGLDIVSYTGNGSNRTISHSLGVAPEMMIVKDRTASSGHSWCVYHKDLTSASYYLYLDDTLAQSSSSVIWNSTAPTSSVFSIGTGTGVNTNNNDYIAYLFAGVEGFSKFGKYTGNASSDGPFVWCGFRPAYVLLKRIDSANMWESVDSAINTYNISNVRARVDAIGLIPYNGNTQPVMDILSNGFKIRWTDAEVNASGGSYIFAAFAEHPFKYARAR